MGIIITSLSNVFIITRNIMGIIITSLSNVFVITRNIMGIIITSLSNVFVITRNIMGIIITSLSNVFVVTVQLKKMNAYHKQKPYMYAYVLLRIYSMHTYDNFMTNNRFLKW